MFKLEFSTDNAAFDANEDGGMATEIARILRDIQCRVEEGTLPDGEAAIVRDVNGNAIGRWSVS